MPGFTNKPHYFVVYINTTSDLKEITVHYFYGNADWMWSIKNLRGFTTLSKSLFLKSFDEFWSGLVCLTVISLSQN